MPLRPANDPIVEDIAQRVRGIVARLPASHRATLANSVGVPNQTFCRLLGESRCTGNACILIDVIAEGERRLREFVHEQYRQLRDDAWSSLSLGRLFRPWTSLL